MGRLKAESAVLPPLDKLPGREPAKLAAALAKASGKAVIVNFWASWCEPCRQEMPALQRLASRRKDIAVILVAVNDRQGDMEDFLWEKEIALPALMDRTQAVSRAWSVRALPTSLILDEHHALRYRSTGPLDWDGAEVAHALASLQTMP